jgi:hypothetical protein
MGEGKNKGITAIDGKLSDQARKRKRLEAIENDPDVLSKQSFNLVCNCFDKMPNDRVRQARMLILISQLRVYVGITE